MNELDDAVEEYITTQIMGSNGACSYLKFIRDNGYKYHVVLSNSSSAGDWQFIVSKDGLHWHILQQWNNWPKAGYTCRLYCEDDNLPPVEYEGTAEEVLEYIALWNMLDDAFGQ